MDKAMRTRSDAEREAIAAINSAALDDPFIHRGLAMIYHGTDPLEAWRDVAVALAMRNADLFKRLLDILAVMPSPTFVMPAEKCVHVEGSQS